MKVKDALAEFEWLYESDNVALACITKYDVEKSFSVNLSDEQWKALSYAIDCELDDYLNDELMDFIQVQLEKT